MIMGCFFHLNLSVVFNFLGSLQDGPYHPLEEDEVWNG